MGRMYSAVMDAVSITAANVPQDLFELLAASNVAVLIHEIRISQKTLTASELLQIKLHRGTSTGSGGGTVTPKALQEGDPAADSTVERNNTTQSVETSPLVIDHWNVVNPWIWLPTPESRILVPGGGLFIVELETDPSATFTVSGTIIFEELG